MICYLTINTWKSVILIATLFIIKMETGSLSPDTLSTTTEFDWRVVRVFPHDPGAFTQGLVFRDGYIYESTGRKGESTLRKVRLETGEVIREQQVESEYFAEGLTDWNDKLIQLTLNSGVGFVYDLDSFKKKKTFQFSGEGWGLTNDGSQLIMSDGTSTLRFLNPETFQVTRQVTVTKNGEPFSGLNELEMIDDRVFANILFRDEIAVINPTSGEVTGRINLQELVSMVEREAPVNVLNGIAYDTSHDRIFVTGKLWPKLFEIEIWERP